MEGHALIEVSLLTLFSLSLCSTRRQNTSLRGLVLALAMYISCLLFRFQLRLVPNVNPISSGIWALDFNPIDPNPAISARVVLPQSGHIRPEKRPFFQRFPHFSKIEP